MNSKRTIRNRFERAIESYDSNAIAQKSIAQKLFTTLNNHITNDLKNSLEFGCGTGNLSYLLQTLGSDMLLNDLCPKYKTILEGKLHNCNYEFLAQDALELVAELRDSNRKFDLIASSSAIQWLNDPVGFIKSCLDLLPSSGLMAISTFVEGNIGEVTSITAGGLNYPKLEEYRTVLQSSCEILELSTENITLYFETPFDVLSHLKLSGVTANSLEKQWTRGDLRKFSEEYISRYSSANHKGLPLTYSPLYIVCRKL